MTNEITKSLSRLYKIVLGAYKYEENELRRLRRENPEWVNSKEYEYREHMLAFLMETTDYLASVLMKLDEADREEQKVKEIERKFLVTDPKQIPDLPITLRTKTQQNYLSTGETEVRIRRTVILDEKGNPSDQVYYLAVKNGNGMVRDENEIPISAKSYYQISDLIKERPLSKRRYEMYYKGHTVEYDVYEDFGLHVIEIEFSSEEEAKSFTPPDWFGVEVTHNEEYKAQNLWRKLNGRV